MANNNLWTNAVPIKMTDNMSVTVDQDNTGFTATETSPTGSPTAGQLRGFNGAWYTMSFANTTQTLVAYTGFLAGAYLQIFTKSGSTWTEVAFGNTTAAGGGPALAINPVVGTVYYLRAANYTSASNQVIELNCTLGTTANTPYNSQYTQPFSIQFTYSSWNHQVDNTNAAYTVTETIPPGTTLNGTRGAWYTYVPGTTGSLSVKSITTTGGLRIRMWSVVGSTWTQIFTVDRITSTAASFTQSATVTAGVLYFIRFASSSGAAQNQTITLTGPGGGARDPLVTAPSTPIKVRQKPFIRVGDVDKIFPPKTSIKVRRFAPNQVRIQLAPLGRVKIRPKVPGVTPTLNLYPQTLVRIKVRTNAVPSIISFPVVDMSDKLAFYGFSSAAQVTSLPLGLVAPSSSDDTMMRIANLDYDNQASGVAVSVTDTTKSLYVSVDGVVFGSTVDLGTVPPQAASVPFWVRRVTASTVTAGNYTANLTAVATAWSLPADYNPDDTLGTADEIDNTPPTGENWYG